MTFGQNLGCIPTWISYHHMHISESPDGREMPPDICGKSLSGRSKTLKLRMLAAWVQIQCITFDTGHGYKILDILPLMETQGGLQSLSKLIKLDLNLRSTLHNNIVCTRTCVSSLFIDHSLHLFYFQMTRHNSIFMSCIKFKNLLKNPLVSESYGRTSNFVPALFLWHYPAMSSACVPSLGQCL